MEAQNRTMERLETSYIDDYINTFLRMRDEERDLREILNSFENVVIKWIKEMLGNNLLVLLAPMKQNGVSFWEHLLRRGNWKVVKHIVHVMDPVSMGLVTTLDGRTVFEVCTDYQVPVEIIEAVMKKTPPDVWLKTSEDGVMKSLDFLKHPDPGVREVAKRFIPNKARAHPDFDIL